jgi:hypothetical protein
MRESRTCGSERGAPSNGRPYREKQSTRLHLARQVGDGPVERSQLRIVGLGNIDPGTLV